MRTEHRIRTEDGTAVVTLTPARAIKYKCMDCSCWQRSEVRECAVPLCPLYPFRGWVGASRPLSEEARAANAERLAAMRARRGRNCQAESHSFGKADPAEG